MATTISQGYKPNAIDSLVGGVINSGVGALTGGLSGLFNAGQDLASNFFNPQVQASGLPPTQQQILGVQSAQGLSTSAQSNQNYNYNQAASQGKVAAPVNPTSGYSQPGDSQLQQLQKVAASGGLNPYQAQQLAALQQQQDPYASVRNDIGSSWDSYLNSLNDTSGFIGSQRDAQTGIADSQLQQGITTANDNKAKSLRDIANTTRNAFQAGNNYLGAMGAGDSSAANQYSFAINQQASKQTGDLNNFVSSQIQGLQSTHDQQIQQIASWFAQQQEALKQQIAQGQLSKGQDLANLSKNILDQAIQATNAIKSNTQNQYNALVTWAANNSQNIGQLGNNISQVGRMFQPGQVQTVGAPNNNGGYFPGGGGGSNDQQKLNLFGQPY